MQCSSCNSDLDTGSDYDTGNVTPDSITENFKCTNEKCGKNFEIEFHPINIIALD
jgi:hypothetical protein